MPSPRKKIAILGGGCAGLTAAFYLSNTESLRREFEITVYQEGWRLGGKGASGRHSEYGERIQEHGLHMWLGWYFNAFRLARDTFDVWETASPNAIRSCEQAFTPVYEAMLHQGADAASKPLYLNLPPRPGLPWLPTDPLSHRAALKQLLQWLKTGALWQGLWRNFNAGSLSRVQIMASLRISRALLHGIGQDLLAKGQIDYAALDQQEFCDWLQSHGARLDDVQQDPTIRAFYDFAFAYPSGIRAPDQGQVAAGCALRTLIQLLFAYRGAPLWRVAGSMADTLFAPMYQVLQRRGVKFEFFHQVKNLQCDGEGKAIARIELQHQARLKSAPEPYQALRWLKGYPVWPDQPDWSQLQDGSHLQQQGINFEAINPKLGSVVTLKQGRDFDTVVLAIPAPCLAPMTPSLAQANPAWQAMLDNTHSVATHSAQIWLPHHPAQLGRGHDAPIQLGLEGEFGALADMQETLQREAWDEHQQPGSVFYLCDVCTDRTSVEDPLQSWWQSRAQQLWPDLVSEGDASQTRSQLALERRFYQRNLHPNQRYVLSLPGTTQYRLAADQSGFNNLFLAGDWTRTKINGGSIEAAVESGMQAARAIGGQPLDIY